MSVNGFPFENMPSLDNAAFASPGNRNSTLQAVSVSNMLLNFSDLLTTDQEPAVNSRERDANPIPLTQIAVLPTDGNSQNESPTARGLSTGIGHFERQLNGRQLLDQFSAEPVTAYSALPRPYSVVGTETVKALPPRSLAPSDLTPVIFDEVPEQPSLSSAPGHSIELLPTAVDGSQTYGPDNAVTAEQDNEFSLQMRPELGNVRRYRAPIAFNGTVKNSEAHLSPTKEPAALPLRDLVENSDASLASTQSPFVEKFAANSGLSRESTTQDFSQKTGADTVRDVTPESSSLRSELHHIGIPKAVISDGQVVTAVEILEQKPSAPSGESKDKDLSQAIKSAPNDPMGSVVD